MSYNIHSGESSEGIILENDCYMYVFSGGIANSTTVNSGGELCVFSGGTAINIDWTPCEGHVFVSDGGYATFVSQYSGVYYGSDNKLLSNAVLIDGMTISSLYEMNVMNGGTANNTTVNSGGALRVYSDGTANSTTVNSKGYLYVSSGGTANDTTIKYGGRMCVSSGGTANVVTYNGNLFYENMDYEYGICVSSGGTVNSATFKGKMYISGGMANNTTVNSKGYLYVSSGGVANFTTVSGFDGEGVTSFGYMDVYNGATANMTTVIVGFLTISFGGTANDTIINSRGYLHISSGGTANGTVVNSRGGFSIQSGGTANSTTVNGGGFYVDSGGTANSTTVNGGGHMSVSSGGTANRTTVDSFGYLYVSSGGTAANIIWTPCVGEVCVADGAVATFVSQYSGVYYGSGNQLLAQAVYMDNTMINHWGEMYLMSNGTANNTTVSCGCMHVFRGGTANSIFINSDGCVFVSSGGTANSVFVNSGGSTCIFNGGIANSTTIYSEGSMFVNSGGTANDASINVGGSLDIASGGVANSPTIHSGASLAVSKDVAVYNTVVYENGELHICSGGTACNTKVFAAGRVKVLSGGTLTGKMNYMAGAIVSVEKGAILDFDLTQTAAGGKAILSDWSLIQGTPDCVLTVSASQSSGIYKLADNADEFDGTLSVRDTAGESFGTLAVGGALAVGKATYKLTLDDESLVLTITGGAKPDTQAPTVSNIRASTTKQTDQAVTVTAVFADDIALKSSLHKLGENGIWKDYVNGVTVTENMTIYFKAVDVAGNESKIASYKVANIKKAESDSPSGTPDNGRNNWLYVKTLGVNPDFGDFVATDVSASTEEIPLDRDGDVDSEEWQNYVGYDDLADFARISLENDAKLSFLANATGAAKLVIYRLTEGTGKKAGTYTMKALQTTTLKKPKGSTEYTAETKGLLLVAGDYYIAMKSTGSKKGGTAYYNVNLNEKSAFFTNGDGGWNNWLYEKKTGPNPNRDDFITTVISSSTEEIQLDRDGDVDSEDWLNFVGYGDAADYAKIVLNGEAKLSFLILATDAAKFVIYRLTEKISKKGVVTYSKKTLQTTKLKKDKQTQMYAADTKALKLGAGEYYISVQSTNAKQGGNAFYSVNLNEERSWFSEALLDTKVADALECDNTLDREVDLFATGLENMLDDSQSVRLGIANLA